MISETKCINYLIVCNIVVRSDARVLFSSTCNYSMWGAKTSSRHGPGPRRAGEGAGEGGSGEGGAARSPGWLALLIIIIILTGHLAGSSPPAESRQDYATHDRCLSQQLLCTLISPA